MCWLARAILFRSMPSNMARYEDADMTKEQHADLLQFNRDQLFAALRLALPGATHDQIKAVVIAMDSFVSAKALEVMSL